MKWKRFSIPDVYFGFLLLPVIGFIALISTLVLPMISSHSPAFIETEGVEADGITKMLEVNFTSVVREGDKVRLHSTHFLDAGRGFVHDLTLVPHQGFHIPDKHATESFVLTAVTKDGIELTYDDRFDHRDFGHNKITEDSGTVKIPWQKKP